ncbi:MAG: peptidoglycan DD-metalloendopeptidase family protein [Leptolyngbyaceae cyanobacterium bins.302]|nr:peptidoglycan DD-metalloendopeptidase family protein [Leptolyngbyaceae cyanobacterium bins.302]
MATQEKQALSEGNRRVRTSAAMLGLAVSVGAYGLPLPHQGDQAVAAEPNSADATASNTTTSFETAAVHSVDEVTGSSSSPESSSLPIQHTVQEGQTLWDVARFYGTDASILASANKLSLNSVLRVGQVLIVPVDSRIAQAVDSVASSASPGYYGPVSTLVSPSQAVASSAQVDGQLKSNQNQAVEALKQKRESLRSSLAKLNHPTSQPSPVVAGNLPTQSETKIASIASISPSSQAEVPQTQAGSATATDQKVAFQTPTQFPGANVNAIGTVGHRVAPGDTLSSIARANGVPVKKLLEANQISDPNYIFVGQTIIIPGQQANLPRDKFDGAIAVAPSSTVTDVSDSVASVAAPVPSSAVSANRSELAAATTFTGNPQSVEAEDSNSNLLRYNHVENLKLEIDRLRERYKSDSGRSQVSVRPETKVAVSTPRVSTPPAAISEPVNPEFNPQRYSARLQEIRDRIRPASTRAQAVAPVSAQNTQVVAAAPLGSESYDPIQSRLGRTVSPELPSLGTGSEFLPSVPGQMNGFIWPTKGVLTSGYGWRWGRMHKGIDIAGPIGTPIVAAADGRITYAGWNSGGYGYLVEIQHEDGSLTLYAHNNRILVQVGQEVAQGQQIAEMGSTGYSTGPHLHFEVHPTGKGAVNPMPFLQARG